MNNMFNNNNGFSSSGQSQYEGELDGALAKTFMANVYAFMFAALAVSGLTAYVIGTNEAMWMNIFINESTGQIGMLYWVIAFSPFAFILALNYGINKFSASVLTIIFIAFAFVMGLSLSSIFMVYSMGSIAQTFFITAGTFGVMSFLGYTTKTDLTKFGSILMMALIGLIIAMVVNWFMQSEFMGYVISMVGVLIFTGLIAYDTQKLKRIGAGVEYGSDDAKKLAILGATSLYLDFINLFLFLLRILGSRD